MSTRDGINIYSRGSISISSSCLWGRGSVQGKCIQILESREPVTGLLAYLSSVF